MTQGIVLKRTEKLAFDCLFPVPNSIFLEVFILNGACPEENTAIMGFFFLKSAQKNRKEDSFTVCVLSRGVLGKTLSNS